MGVNGELKQVIPNSRQRVILRQGNGWEFNKPKAKKTDMLGNSDTGLGNGRILLEDLTNEELRQSGLNEESI